ncbi:MAG: exosortase/archaeosortase family protein [Pirellulales bacterium]|nr:exosortase/archaeosortase family protein [Pirellulales bacterium]
MSYEITELIPKWAHALQAREEDSRRSPPHDIRQTEEPDKRTFWLVGGVLAVLLLWSYWPTIAALVGRWRAVPDYSHGFLVPPLALGFLWLRRGTFPRVAGGLGWAALAAFGAATAMRAVSARYVLPALDGWSIPVCLAGICLLYGGERLLRWCLPSLGFLLFMVPLPHRVEWALSVPLRQLATTFSCWFLQFLGQPAVEEGTAIICEEQTLNVAQECSGLRMLVGIMALAFAYTIVSRRPWWQKALLLASAAPVAIAANVLRITLTALLFRHVSAETSDVFSHDAAGWFTNCAAAVLFAAVLWCIGRMFVETETVSQRELLR